MANLRRTMILLPLTGAMLLVAGAQAAGLKAGVAKVDITPPVSFRMSGYFEERLSTGIKDRLYAKAVVFEQGEVSAALVFCDLIGVPLEVSERARRRASAATGIPLSNIAVAATHSHTGPLYYDALRKHFHERAVDRHGKDPHEPIDYGDELAGKIEAAVVAAKAAAQPVELRSDAVDERRLSFNRRFHMKDGSVRFNPGELNPDIVRPAGPIDPQVCVVTLTPTSAAKPAAAIVSFALHLDTVSGTEYSADYPKHCEDRLRELIDPQIDLLYGTGTCGDINHIDVTTRKRRTAAEIGHMLAGTVSEAIEQCEPARRAGIGLAVKSVKVDAALQQFSAAEVAQAAERMELIGTRQLPFLEQVEAYKITNLQQWNQPTLPLEVQVFRLDGDTAIVMLPGEVFVELGLAIKAASPFRTTLVVELANHSPAYIPTKRAFAEGSYEVVNSQVEPGSGERMAEAAARLLNELQ